jgi:hypothetical protein
LAKRIPEKDLEAIEAAIRRHPGGVTFQQIADVFLRQTARV